MNDNRCRDFRHKEAMKRYQAKVKDRTKERQGSAMQSAAASVARQAAEDAAADRGGSEKSRSVVTELDSASAFAPHDGAVALGDGLAVEDLLDTVDDDRNGHRRPRVAPDAGPAPTC